MSNEQPVTFYTVIGEGPDGFGRHRFVMYWWGYHPFTGHSPRGQVFHGVVAEHRGRIEARGHRLVEVESAEAARELATADGIAAGEQTTLDVAA